MKSGFTTLFSLYHYYNILPRCNTLLGILLAIIINNVDSQSRYKYKWVGHVMRIDGLIISRPCLSILNTFKFQNLHNKQSLSSNRLVHQIFMLYLNENVHLIHVFSELKVSIDRINLIRVHFKQVQLYKIWWYKNTANT